MAGKIGDYSDFSAGSSGNIRRDLKLADTVLNERLKVDANGDLGYRVDIKGVGHKKIGGHLTASDLGGTD